MKSEIEEEFIDLSYHVGRWEKPHRLVCRILWYENELFPGIGFVVTNSRITVEKVIKFHNHRAEIEKKIKEHKKPCAGIKRVAIALNLTRPG